MFRMRNLIGLLLILALLSTAGCGKRSSASSQDPGAKTKTGSNSSSDAGSGSDGGSETASTGNIDSGSTEATTSPDFDLPPNYVRASIASNGADDPTPRDCGLARGETCKASFKGRYQLKDYPSGAIMAAVYEDDSTEPAYSAKLPIEQRGGSQFFLDLPFKISNSVKKLSFKTFLLGPDGKVIDEGGVQTADVP